MKIIEALKSVKDLKRKLYDIHKKIETYSADNSTEVPVYENQKGQIDSWLQACEDINKEICSLIHRIHKTNVVTNIPIEITSEKTLTKTIDEWLLRLSGLTENDKNTWEALNVANINMAHKYRLPNTTTDVAVTRRLYFDPKKRDAKIEEYTAEKIKIQSKLEIVNATTDLIE